MLDTLIQNVSILDGSGSPAYTGNIGMSAGKFELVFGTELPTASLVIDGTGLAAMPGLIDAHSHGDLNLVSAYAQKSKLSQGITTQIAGQCGVSMFPARPDARDTAERFAAGIATCPDLPERMDALRDAGAFIDWMHTVNDCIDTRLFVGHGALRLWAMGYERRAPDPDELNRMCDMLRRCIRSGALGLSTGLVYAPCCYAQDDEILALLRVVSEEGGIYATHPRNEADSCVEARAESIRMAHLANVPLCLSHMKAAGRRNWGKPKLILRMAEQAVDSGMKILMDDYPYTAGSTSLNVSIPPRWFENGTAGLCRALSDKQTRSEIRAEMEHPGDFENYIANCGGFSGVFVSSLPIDRSAEGRFISEYAESCGIDPFDAYCDILVRNNGLGLGIYFHMDRSDVLDILSHPLCVVGTDALLGASSANPHPRAFGTTARAFHLLSDESGRCTAEQAVRKMSGQTADWFGLAQKGYIRDGYDADLVLIDPARFRDTATYAHGSSVCTGILRVYHRGKCVYREENQE